MRGREGGREKGSESRAREKEREGEKRVSESEHLFLCIFSRAPLHFFLSTHWHWPAIHSCIA